MRSKIPLLIVIAALLILGLLVFFGALNRIRYLAADLPSALESALEASSGRPVRVGSVRLVSPAQVVITDLAIADGKTFSQGTLFAARQAVVRLNTADLLLGRTTLARSSPPGLDNLQALSLVFGGATLQALIQGVPLEGVLQEQLPQVLLGLALPELFEPLEVEGVVFAIEPGFDIPLLFTASTFLTDRLILSYSRSVVGSTPLDTLSFSYTLRPDLAFTVQLEGLNRTSAETTYLVNYFRRF